MRTLMLISIVDQFMEIRILFVLNWNPSCIRDDQVEKPDSHQ